MIRHSVGTGGGGSPCLMHSTAAKLKEKSISLQHYKYFFSNNIDACKANKASTPSHGPKARNPTSSGKSKISLEIQ